MSKTPTLCAVLRQPGPLQRLRSVAAQRIEELKAALPPLRAGREEIARWQATKTKLLEFHSTFLSRTSQRDASFFISVDQYEAQRLTDALLDAAIGLEEAAHAPSAVQGDQATMQALSASEAAGYFWPEDTDEHKALRAAYILGAASVSPAVQGEWRDISTAPKEPLDDGFGPEILLHSPKDELCIGFWDDCFKKFVTETGEQPTHWMPRPSPPVAEPKALVAEGESDAAQ